MVLCGLWCVGGLKMALWAFWCVWQGVTLSAWCRLCGVSVSGLVLWLSVWLSGGLLWLWWSLVWLCVSGGLCDSSGVLCVVLCLWCCRAVWCRSLLWWSGVLSSGLWWCLLWSGLLVSGLVWCLVYYQQCLKFLCTRKECHIT